MKVVGEDITVSTSVKRMLETFLSELYGMKNSSDINAAQYEKFCAKDVMPEPHQLPPTQDAFRCHLQRAHYTALTWKSALKCDPIKPSREGYGWTVSVQNHLQIY